MPAASPEPESQPCAHENITTTLIAYQGAVISAQTVCDDCNTTLTND
jgi:hypothetical protein